MAEANSSDSRTAVAVIGAGIMGSAMARNLVAAGLTTRVWDRSPSATGPLADAGAVVAASAREAVRDAGVVITMLPTADVVDSVVFDAGVAGAFADGCVWAQMGTIGVEATLRIRDRLAAQQPGVMFVDAPVSGSKGPAEQGQLLILASGPAAAADVLRPVFDVIGRKTVWLGEAGQGSQMKLVVNAYMSILIEGVAETMELADRLGIGHQQLAEVIEGGPLDAPIADAKLHKMDQQDYAAEFPLEWALKDVDLAIGAAGGEAPPLLAALSGQWHAAVAAGHGRQDVSAARLALTDPRQHELAQDQPGGHRFPHCGAAGHRRRWRGGLHRAQYSSRYLLARGMLGGVGLGAPTSKAVPERPGSGRSRGKQVEPQRF